MKLLMHFLFGDPPYVTIKWGLTMLRQHYDAEQEAIKNGRNFTKMPPGTY